MRIGVVLGEPEHDEDNRRLRRKVRWFDEDHDVTGLPRHVQRQLTTSGNIVDVTSVVPGAPGAPAGRSGSRGRRRRRADAAVEPASMKVPAADAASSPSPCTWTWSRCRRSPNCSRRTGSWCCTARPGTGKTYLAKHLAAELAGDTTDERVKLVQFHPSYAYEDFFEGFRPDKTDEGQVSFKLVAGPLRRLAEEAAKPGNESKPYFLIIDEMNRANLAKVFGELYFLLEYRDDRIYLQYSPNEPFTLPDNLYIIGTMNTADRSIAMMDAAIRRRFAFIELHPQTEPVKGSLLRFLQARQLDTTPALLLDALNAAIDEWDRDLMIGPSYFMKTPPRPPRACAGSGSTS